MIGYADAEGLFSGMTGEVPAVMGHQVDSGRYGPIMDMDASTGFTQDWFDGRERRRESGARRV